LLFLPDSPRNGALALSAWRWRDLVTWNKVQARHVVAVRFPCCKTAKRKVVDYEKNPIGPLHYQCLLSGGSGRQDDAIPGSTQGNGLCATLASRGCGKSFVVDLLCRLHNKTHDGSLVLGDELNARLVPVCISFNGPQDVEADRNESAQVQLLSRLAHRAFFDGNPESWSAFSRKTREAWSEIEPEILLDAMLLYFEKIGILCPIVFVALDEVIKCGHSHAVEVLRMLKLLLSGNTQRFRLLVTTFDDHLLVDGGIASANLHNQAIEDRERTGSKRPIAWLPLFPLLLENPKRVLLALNHSRPPHFSEDQIDYLLALSGGHPRSLALLKELLESKGQSTLVQLVELWLDSMRQFIEDVADPVMKVVLAQSLLGVTVGMKETIAGVSVQSLIQDSVILNSMHPQERFVPHLSLLRLQIWCKNQSIECKTRTRDHDLWIRLSTLLELGKNTQHRSFEEFHLIFEELRCWAWHYLDMGSACKLKEWLAGAQHLRGNGNVELAVPRAELLQTCELEVPLSDNKAQFVHTLAMRNQPGFDIVRRMGAVTLLEECRYSEPPSDEERTGTVLAPAEDVRRKAVLAAQEASGQPLPVFVLVAFRDPSGDLVEFAKACEKKPHENHEKASGMWSRYDNLTMPVFVFDRAALLRRYGPTFKLLGGFVFDYSARNHNVGSAKDMERGE
jgi:hypothetical protein